MTSQFNITVVGAGYVGFTLAAILAQKNIVSVLDIDHDKVKRINSNKSAIEDKGIDEFLLSNKIEITATIDQQESLSHADYVIIATPTNYDASSNSFDTRSVEDIIKSTVEINPKCSIAIKSTVPIGFTAKIKEKYPNQIIFFSPEFLREGSALNDNLNPSRIIIGCTSKQAKVFADLLQDATLKKNVPVLFMGSSEAEAVKLFSNTYLAMRVAYFNEIDSFTIIRNMNPESIINGICHDERIGNFYNNPSFGYGGYCLPKDTKQLLANYEDIPQNLIQAVVEANNTRKAFIAEEILNKNPKCVGIFRLIMKKNSDNFRFSAINEIINFLDQKKIKIKIFEPTLSKKVHMGIEVCNNLSTFKNDCDLIVANRNSDELRDIQHKIFTRDLFDEN